jgi:hypothetical protein
MRRINYTYGFIITAAAIALLSCREKYSPVVTAITDNFLVAEGMINVGADSTIIKLSRTVRLSEFVASRPELKATVTVENNAGASYKLNELGSGVYAAGPLSLNANLKHRIRIKTTGSKEYVSDFVDAHITPPIDSLFGKVLDNKLQICVNTHNTANNTRYYRWSYDETYQYTARYPSYFISVGRTIVPRDLAVEDVYTCWRTLASTNVLLGSSIRLSQNVINEAYVTDFASSSQKISIKYSINLKQYAISEEAFTFWQNLRKNTEQLGSIFDAQPAQIQGNIHATANAAEPVFGYISAGTVAQKRIFISKANLPAAWQYRPAEICDIQNVLYFNPDTREDEVASKLYPKVLIPTNPIVVIDTKTGAQTVTGYQAAVPACVDCTVQGGKNKKPVFWQ